MKVRHVQCLGSFSQLGGSDLSEEKSGLFRSVVMLCIATGIVVWGLAIWKVVDLIG